jgi:hypothetical protein
MTNCQAICAVIVGTGQCEALGHDVRAAALVLALCRELIEAGHDPGRSLAVYRGGVLALRIPRSAKSPGSPSAAMESAFDTELQWLEPRWFVFPSRLPDPGRREVPFLPSSFALTLGEILRRHPIGIG